MKKRTNRLIGFMLTLMLLLGLTSGLTLTAHADIASFVKVTSEDQISEENIGACTEAEAKAWALANWDNIKSVAGNHDIIVLFNDEAIVYNFCTWSTQSKESFENATATTDSIDNIQYFYTYDNDDVYICTGTTPVETVELTFNEDDATVTWEVENGSGVENPYWLMKAVSDRYHVVIKGYGSTPAGTHTWEQMDKYVTYVTDNVEFNSFFFNDGSATVTVNGDSVSVVGNFVGKNGKNYKITVTKGSAQGVDEQGGGEQGGDGEVDDTSDTVSENPETGDSGFTALWILLALVSVCGPAALVIGRKRIFVK